MLKLRFEKVFLSNSSSDDLTSAIQIDSSKPPQMSPPVCHLHLLRYKMQLFNTHNSINILMSFKLQNITSNFTKTRSGLI